jgi:hypothetical protein
MENKDVGALASQPQPAPSPHKEINLKDVNWSKMNPEDFIELEKKLQQSIKVEKARKKYENGAHIIKIADTFYRVKNSDYVRLKRMRSQKSLIKFKEYIIKTYSPCNIEDC